MSKEKQNAPSESAAKDEVRPLEALEAKPEAEEAKPLDAPKVEAPKGPLPGTLEFWALAKGHIPKPGPIKRRGDIHRGPHVDVVRAHSGLALNSLISEAQYDSHVAAAYSLAIKER